MSYKYQGDATLGVSLTMQTPKPLDARLVVDTRAELYTIPTKYAYSGMPVVCVADGNIYTLIDKNNIANASGWKASYESVQIVTCTEEEYNTWKNNTKDNYTPKDDTITWLHQDIYYYIYEDSIDDKGQYYVSYSQFADLTDQVNKKATLIGLNNLADRLDKELENLATVYATLDDIDSTNSESKLSKTLSDYYTKEKTDDIFVTKESLRGGSMEGDDFVFVTQTQYNKDQETLATYQKETAQELSEKVITNSDAELKSISTDSNKLVIGEKVTINDKPLALDEDVPKIIVMDQQEYDALDKKESDVYYMTHGTELDNGGMVTSQFLEENYYSQKQIIELFKYAMSNLFSVSGNTLVLGTSAIDIILIEKPTDQTFEYDGQIHTLQSTEDYTVVGEGGSDPGTYKFKVILNVGKWWKDETNTPIFITYTINKEN